MSNKRIKTILYCTSAAVIVFSFSLKLVIDAVNKNIAQGIDGVLSIRILVCSIIFALSIFSFFIFVQYKLENKRGLLSCIYNPKYMCCLLDNGSLDNIFEETTELMNDVELAKYERQVDTKEVWLLSPDLSCEEGENIFKEVVRVRLNEGIQYSFIALDSPISQERAKKIKEQYKSFFTNKNMHFYLISGDEFSLFLSLYSIAIYNPTDNLGSTQAYVCVGESEGSETSIYAKLNTIHTQTATNITREIIRNTKEFIP